MTAGSNGEKPPPVDLAKTKAQWDHIDRGKTEITQRLTAIRTDEDAIEQKKWDIARDLWTAARVDGLSGQEIADRVNRNKRTVTRRIKVWGRYGDMTEGRPCFSDALGEVQNGIADPKERNRYKEQLITDRVIRQSSPMAKVELAAELLEDDNVQKELTKSPERGGKVAAALIENDNVAIAARRVMDKRLKAKRKAARAQQKADQKAALEATFNERDKAVLGRKGPKAQAEVLAQEATKQDAPNDDRVYVSPEGDVYNHDYDKENPDTPFIETASGSKVNWHDPLMCETRLPADWIGDIERGIDFVTGPMYVLGLKDKQRLRAALTKGLEALK